MKTLALLAILCFANNSPQVPNSQPASTNNAGESKGVAPVTVVNNCGSATQAQQKSDTGPQRSASVWGNVPDWVLAVVGVFTLFAVIKQAVETKNAAVQTARSADAADKSAKAAVDNIVYTHRPKLVIRGIGLVAGKYVTGESGTTIQDDVQWQVKYIVANMGGTDAHVTDSNLTITHINVVDGELFPEFPPYSESRDSMGVFTIKPGEHQERMVVLNQESDTLRLRVLRKMVQGGGLHTSGTAYLLGFIQYRDDAGVSRRTAFFRHYDAQTERFRRDKYPETPDSYEYAD